MQWDLGSFLIGCAVGALFATLLAVWRPGKPGK